MKFCIIIPFFNEEVYINTVLNSFILQTITPNKLLLIDDGSTDSSFKIAKEISKNYSWINVLQKDKLSTHQPGKKVINAFYYGMESISIDNFDLIGKFDADIILPKNYFEKILNIFLVDKKIGIAAGNLYIKKNNNWVYENISKKTKTRGPIKLYRKECFKEIGGLKKSIGWDTVDELLAKYHGWKVVTDESLHVKHLKPTGKTYTKAARYKQGEAFYKMRYGFWLTLIASAKLAFLKKDFFFAMYCLRGYFQAKKEKSPLLVSEKEGIFIRALRWEKIKEKLFHKKT